MDPQLGTKGSHCVFEEAKAFIFSVWWDAGSWAADDKFRFSANPETEIVEIPVLFWDQGRGAEAWTTNCVNALVDGNTIFVPETFGPEVDREGGTGTVSDIFRDYVESAYALCGYTPKTGIKFADARWYHSRGGSIHCGTNVVRTIPTDKWWEFGP